MTQVEHFVAGDGCRIGYRFDGAENLPLLLLSNSLGTDMTMWTPQLDGWARHFRVLRYDQRGHGASDAPAGGYSLDRLGRDVVELLDTLEIGSVDLCGLSLGGMVGQWLAIREPDRIRRLVLANTSAFMGPPANWDARILSVREGGMASVGRASIERWFTPDFVAREPNIVAKVGATLRATSMIGYTGCCAAIRDMDMRSTIASISSPTLVIGGLQDHATPPIHSEFLAQSIGGAGLAMLDAAHLANIERAAEFEAAVRAFLVDGIPSRGVIHGCPSPRKAR